MIGPSSVFIRTRSDWSSGCSECCVNSLQNFGNVYFAVLEGASKEFIQEIKCFAEKMTVCHNEWTTQYKIKIDIIDISMSAQNHSIRFPLSRKRPIHNRIKYE